MVITVVNDAQERHSQGSSQIIMADLSQDLDENRRQSSRISCTQLSYFVEPSVSV
jgi:hypothetical protein